MVLFFDTIEIEEVSLMKIEEGYLYHISQEFFELVDDPNLQINHSGVHSRPSYFLVNDGDLLWFIPLSSKVSKYKKIMNEKKFKYGKNLVNIIYIIFKCFFYKIVYLLKS